LHKYKPQGILSFGGYLAVPTVICGWLLGIPSVTHEQTIVAGLANKLISLFVKKIAISWPQSHKHFPPAKVVFTGLPIRKEVLKIISNKKKITKTPAIYVTGGKQGSHVINQATFPLVPELSKNFTIIHQTGSTSLNSDYEQAIELSKIYPNYHPFDYDSQKAASALSEASVVVSRSGAHITYELGILGIRCVLIPLPNSSHSEQELNAKSLEKSHQAIILSQDQLSPKSLHNAILSASKLNPEPINLPIDADNKLFQLIIDTLPI
jgi:UDP-N-acetylglucosamine--N-acetylmuramyl-(pentapeptide) pyrophosphoryl-undecaprenol N-acetylglucosamine transferase